MYIEQWLTLGNIYTTLCSLFWFLITQYFRLLGPVSAVTSGVPGAGESLWFGLPLLPLLLAGLTSLSDVVLYGVCVIVRVILLFLLFHL